MEEIRLLRETELDADTWDLVYRLIDSWNEDWTDEERSNAVSFLEDGDESGVPQDLRIFVLNLLNAITVA